MYRLRVGYVQIKKHVHMDKKIKKVTVTDFRAGLSHYLELLKSGVKIEVRGVILGKIEDVHEKNEDVQMPVQTHVQTDDKTTKPTVHEFCNLVGNQASNIRDLKMMVSEIENGKIKSDPEPEGAWHKEEEEEVEEEKNFVRCDLCKEGQAEKTFYEAGGAGEVEICRQCARTKYAGSMRTFDGYWKKLQDINLY
mgnify:CR=1 FL=1